MNVNSDLGKHTRPIYNLILHLHPKKVKASTLRFKLSFGLGGMSALLVVVQIFTGLLLKFHYVPNPEGAYNSILAINENLLFGKLAHNIHYWSAILLLWITFLHMLRVFFTGAYRKPRQATWTFGVLLLILVVLSNFTGYLLPWDQLSYWAVTVSTSILDYVPLIGSTAREALLGGQDVAGGTLSNFFNLHTGIIPLLLLALMVHHFWQIRKAGGLIVSEEEKDSPLVDTQPNLVARELVVSLVLIAFILLLGVLFDAPLRERANPFFSPNPAKAPWYFMGLQELLIHFHPFFAVVVIPIILFAGIFYLPYFKLKDGVQGIWFISQKGRETGKISAIAGFIFTIIFILLSEALPDPESILPGNFSIITTGLIPFIFVVVSIYFFMKIIQRKFSINRSEYIQSLFIILIASYSVLSLVGISFRGEGMSLIWPWLL
ncbi:MAG: cytochrome b N-terminal domain-containing protein [Bacteroidales bacterium]|nr:cytochrome b N-terminal domain-containing protein [Bacteroidales bacterium]MCF8391547.1 cytochrome b N-terminal domain-containing protein [Bacteroidales bacterium]